MQSTDRSTPVRPQSPSGASMASGPQNYPQAPSYFKSSAAEDVLIEQLRSQLELANRNNDELQTAANAQLTPLHIEIETTRAKIKEANEELVRLRRAEATPASPLPPSSPARASRPAAAAAAAEFGNPKLGSPTSFSGRRCQEDGYRPGFGFDRRKSAEVAPVPAPQPPSVVARPLSPAPVTPALVPSVTKFTPATVTAASPISRRVYYIHPITGQQVNELPSLFSLSASTTTLGMPSFASSTPAAHLSSTATSSEVAKVYYLDPYTKQHLTESEYMAKYGSTTVFTSTQAFSSPIKSYTPTTALAPATFTLPSSPVAAVSLPAPPLSPSAAVSPGVTRVIPTLPGTTAPATTKAIRRKKKTAAAVSAAGSNVTSLALYSR